LAPRRNATTPARIKLAEKERRALELRKGGATYNRIAQALGYSDEGGAAKAVKRATVELTERALRNHTGAVYESFCGSGSTLIASENLNRRCYAMEIDPGYCDVIVDRWERHTSETAARQGAVQIGTSA
jgi:DNA modification methylase